MESHKNDNVEFYLRWSLSYYILGMLREPSCWKIRLTFILIISSSEVAKIYTFA